MPRVAHRSTLISLWTILSFGAFCALASPEDTRKIGKSDLRFDLSSLAPESRATLEKIDVLLLDDANIQRVWKLGTRYTSPDVVVVSCSPRCLSTDIFEALASWAKDGHGLFLEASASFMASRFLLPEDYFIEPDYLTFATGHSWLESGSPLTTHVFQIKKELWCARNGKGRLRIHSRSLGEDNLERALLDLGEAFIPTLSWNPRAGVAMTYDAAAFESSMSVMLESSPRDETMPILFASTYQGARIVWYAYDFRTKEDCLPEFDDVRMWSNLIHWLAGEELPEVAAHPGNAR